MKISLGAAVLEKASSGVAWVFIVIGAHLLVIGMVPRGAG